MLYKEWKVEYLDHEKLDVYQVSIEVIGLIEEIILTMPKEKGQLADQLGRAGTSIPLNIAKEAGEWAQNEKCRFYRIAKRSATECVGMISVCRKLEAIEEQLYQEIRKLLIRVVAMLTKMAKKGT